jgi:hypothetical protein
MSTQQKRGTLELIHECFESKMVQPKQENYFMVQQQQQQQDFKVDTCG